MSGPASLPPGRDSAAVVAAHNKERTAQRALRDPLLRTIADARGRPLLAYVTCARPSLSTGIGADAIRLFREHLGKIGKVEKLDLLLVTRGGHTLTPLRLMSLLREFAAHVSVLVPYMAHSAGTLIALGADEIVMGAMGELGPVDPTVSNHFNPIQNAEDVAGGKLPTPRPRLPISVEDVTAYLNLAAERAKLDPQGMLAAFTSLAANVHPLALGNILRSHTLIRRLVRRLLSMHMDGEKEKAAIDSLVEALTEKLYAHDYLITRDEAASLGLKAKKPESDELETAMWETYKLYETYLGLATDINFARILGPDRASFLSLDAAVIEDSEGQQHYFSYRGVLERKGPTDFHFEAQSSAWEKA